MVRTTVKRLLPPIALDVARLLRRQWHAPHRRQWVYQEFIRAALTDSVLQKVFRQRADLPAHYGVGFDERCVEFPWLLSHLGSAEERLLDAGSTLNHEYVLAHDSFRDKSLHIMTLAPEYNCFWQRGISYIFSDLRDIPIRDSFYDTIACISVLEHVGLDNTVYSSDELHNQNATDDFIKVMRELRRVLKPGGQLLLTVPFGTYQHLGWMQQFDRDLLSCAIAAFGAAHTSVEEFYRYHPDGWGKVEAEDCKDCRYAERTASAANAVACIRLTR